NSDHRRKAVVMLSKARIANHPIHPMLIVFPVACYVATVVMLFIHTGTHDVFWYRASMYSSSAGVIMAAVAAIPGLVDLLNLPANSQARETALRHAAFNVLALVFFAACAIMLIGNYHGGVYSDGAPLVVSILGLCAVAAAGWLGWQLV